MPRRTRRNDRAARRDDRAARRDAGRNDRRHRRHGTPVRQPDRRELELDGWRTTLDYRENHRRGPDGRLLGVSSVWHAEAERTPTRAGDGERARGVDVIAATADTSDEAWSRLRLEAELADVRPARVDPRRTGSS